MNVVDATRLGTRPTATGGIARLAYAYARRVGFEPTPLLKKAGLSEELRSVRAQIQFLEFGCEGPGERISRRSQIFAPVRGSRHASSRI